MKQAIKIHDLIEDVKNLFKEDIPKTVYWDYIDLFKEHLNAIRSNYNHERSERIFNDYKRQIDSYLSSKWNEKSIDLFWETEMIATTLQEYHLKNHPDEHLTYFYDSLRSDLNKIPSDSGTLLRLEEYFVEIYIKNALDEQYALIEHFKSNQVKYSPKTFKTGVYVLAYIMDSHALGRNISIYSKKDKENITIRKQSNKNTKYKEFNKIINQDLNTEKFFINYLGDNWKNILLELSENPVKLAGYFEIKGL